MTNMLKLSIFSLGVALMLSGCKTVVSEPVGSSVSEPETFKLYGNPDPIGPDYQTTILDSIGKPSDHGQVEGQTPQAEPENQKHDVQSQANPEAAPTQGKVVRQAPKLPHIEINLEKQYIDINGIVCFREGRAELVATIRGTKPHESPFMIHARPQHVHMALMMLGLQPGKPGHWLFNEETRESTPVDPEGHVVKVTVLMKDASGEMKEYEISKFINNRITKSPLPHSFFVFGGSKFRKTQSGETIYSADSSGNVISLVSFNDELLSWPRAASHSDSQVYFEAYPDNLPDLQTPVKVRIRPVKDITMKELNAMMDQWYQDQESKRIEIEKQFETDQAEQEGK